MKAMSLSTISSSSYRGRDNSLPLSLPWQSLSKGYYQHTKQDIRMVVAQHPSSSCTSAAFSVNALMNSKCFLTFNLLKYALFCWMSQTHHYYSKHTHVLYSSPFVFLTPSVSGLSSLPFRKHFHLNGICSFVNIDWYHTFHTIQCNGFTSVSVERTLKGVTPPLWSHVQRERITMI